MVLGERGKTSFTVLRNELGDVSVGALYHHLDSLAGFIVMQDKARRYYLSHDGRVAYKLLTSREEDLMARIVARARPPLMARLVQRVLLPVGLFSRLPTSPLKSIPQALLIVLFGAWIYGQARTQPIILFVIPNSVMPLPTIMGTFVLSWVALCGICSLLSFFLFRRRGGDIDLLVGLAFALSPLLVFPALVFVDETFRLHVGFMRAPLVMDVLYLFLQAWSLCLITSALSVSKGLRVEKAGVVALAAIYVNIALLLILLGMRWVSF